MQTPTKPIQKSRIRRLLIHLFLLTAAFLMAVSHKDKSPRSDDAWFQAIDRPELRKSPNHPTSN